MKVIENDHIGKLSELIATPSRISVVSHVNPDGDAFGSGIAWTKILLSMGHEVRFIVPNNYPAFLEWMPGIDLVHVYRVEPEFLDRYVADSTLIFCMDFNQLHRLEGLGSAIEQNTSAVRILIDHHLHPPESFDLSFSDITASSTALLTYRIIEKLGLVARIDRDIAQALYVGISTDTGNLMFGNLTEEVYETVSALVKTGIDPAALNRSIYNNYNADRLKLLGCMLADKLHFLPGYHAAYMTLSREEQLKHNYQAGDTEGFVNIPLTVKNIRLSAFFIQTNDCIKVSLRSQGETDVNLLANKYFNGGGHKNASGGKVFDTMEKTVALFKMALKETFG